MRHGLIVWMNPWNSAYWWPPTFEDPEEARDRAAGALNRHNAVETHPEGRGGPA